MFHWETFEDKSEELVCVPFYWTVYHTQLPYGCSILSWLLCADVRNSKVTAKSSSFRNSFEWHRNCWILEFTSGIFQAIISCIFHNCTIKDALSSKESHHNAWDYYLRKRFKYKVTNIHYLCCELWSAFIGQIGNRSRHKEETQGSCGEMNRKPHTIFTTPFYLFFFS